MTEASKNIMNIMSSNGFECGSVSGAFCMTTWVFLVQVEFLMQAAGGIPLLQDYCCCFSAIVLQQ